MQAVTEHFAGSGFKVFATMIAPNLKVEVWAIPAKTGGSRAFCDRMNAWAHRPASRTSAISSGARKAKNWKAEVLLAKNIGEERTDAIRTQLGFDDGDACFFVAGDPAKFYKFVRGEARTRAGEELNLVDRDRFELCRSSTSRSTNGWKTKRRSTSPTTLSMPQGGSA